MVDEKSTEIRMLQTLKELHNFICEHISSGCYKIEELGQEFDWWEPMGDGTLASFRTEIEDYEKELSTSQS